MLYRMFGSRLAASIVRTIGALAGIFACAGAAAAPRGGDDGRGAAPSALYAGYNVGGMEWIRPELSGLTDPQAVRAAMEQVGFDEASMVHRAGGNIIRTLYSSSSLLGAEVKDVFRVPGEPSQPTAKPVYKHTIEERLQRADANDALLGALLESVPKGLNHKNQPMTFETMDGYVAGIERFNATLANRAEYVRVLVTLICQPPRWIVEVPGKGTLTYFNKPYTFGTLWDKFVRLQTELGRAMVRRYVTEPALRRPGVPPVVCAFEVVNEPDYDWIPDEMRIEWSYNQSANALGKYVTELHLQQIPVGAGGYRAYETTAWGHQPQDAWWNDQVRPVGVAEFDWGPKFDWYVKCFAQFHEHVSFAIRDEALKGSTDGVPRVLLISGGVTHNNIDYLIRMYRANPTTFRYVDRIGIHPYHWPNHDIFDTNFVSPAPHDAWRTATPQEYARTYFKRFDFLEEFAALIREPDEARSCGMSGKRLWITEFGVPTKQLGKANVALKDYIKFIRARKGPPLEGVDSRVWEDIWDGFTRQVDRAYLERNMVDALIFYALRETPSPGYDMNDEDRSNFAFFHRDGTPRMDEASRARIDALVRSLTGVR